MKIKNRSNKKKIIIISTVVVVLLFAGIFYFLYINKTDSDNLKDSSPKSENTSSNKEVTKPQTQEKDDQSDDTVEPEPENTPNERGIVVGEDGTPRRNTEQTPGNVNLTITRLETSSSTLTVTTLVNGVNSGDCTIRLSNRTGEKVFTAPIQAGPSYFACQLETPRNQFSTGTWRVTVSAGGGVVDGEVNL